MKNQIINIDISKFIQIHDLVKWWLPDHDFAHIKLDTSWPDLITFAPLAVWFWLFHKIFAFTAATCYSLKFSFIPKYLIGRFDQNDHQLWVYTVYIVSTQFVFYFRISQCSLENLDTSSNLTYMCVYILSYFDLWKRHSHFLTRGLCN